MNAWHTIVAQLLKESGLFSEVQLTGGKIRAFISASTFLDIHFDPTTNSYSYAMIDLTLPYAGDKRSFGWDDFPHPNSPALTGMTSYPHHFQERLPDGKWRFLESAFRGNIQNEIPEVIKVIRQRQAG